MRTFKTEGIIIKRFNVGEADRILTVFTKHAGKYKVRAKGIRRIPSRRSAHVELLNKSVLTLYEGKGIPTLVEANSVESFREIKDDLTKVGFAYHICELIDGLCPDNQEHSDIYELLQQTLSRLSSCHSGDEQERGVQNRLQHDVVSDAGQASMTKKRKSILEVIHDFEIQLLTILGYWKKDPELAKRLNTTAFIEDILERRLKSRRIFSRLD